MYLSWYNHIVGYNNYSEIVLIALVMDYDGPRMYTSHLAPDLTLTSSQDIAHDYPKELKNRQHEVFKLV